MIVWSQDNVKLCKMSIVFNSSKTIKDTSFRITSSTHNRYGLSTSIQSETLMKDKEKAKNIK
jgi:hypothetical protein